MPTIASLRERRDKCSFPWGETDTIELEYRAIPAADLTKADFDALNEAAQGKAAEEQRRVLADFLVPLLAAWNVYEWEKRDPDTGAIVEHGPMLPVTADSILAFDDRFTLACAAAIIEHVNVGKVSGLPLSTRGIASSSPRGDAESSPAGKANRASRRKQSSPRSPSNAGSRRGNSPSIPSGSPS